MHSKPRARLHSKHRTTAGIVTFKPDPADLVQLVSLIGHTTAQVVVFANSPLSADLQEAIHGASSSPVRFLSPGKNVGLGKAYNEIAAIAAESDSEFLLLFDQDSTPSRDMVPRLEAMAESLRARGSRPALVGPLPVNAAGEPFKIPYLENHPNSEGFAAVSFAISSGSLIALDALAAVGSFNEDLFIDAVDIEWCFRARARGWSVWLGMNVPMSHRLGLGMIEVPLGIQMADQPPHRLYTYFRNQTALLRMPHVPLAWKFRFVASVPLRSCVYGMRQRPGLLTLKAIGLGLLDGIRLKLGSPETRWRQLTGTLNELPDGERPKPSSRAPE